ncbi:PhoPQ-activated protein PqaA family protein [Parendozoicomonas haliclonae]|uniref:PhoPQ-activated pathogenicity-related protein n=3 Tax=Parendozoicomonas haliclonae TaxID=1960125 RepID=A0A1X7AE58_9GAMM|nr:PhoPQ-activated pathogenicity-related protein [Parendozoicomonas haliclonae]
MPIVLLQALTCMAEITPGQVMDNNRPVVNSGALAEFISRKVPEFSWEVLGGQKQNGVNVIHLSMTSQSWSPAGLKFTPALWQHRITVVVPDGYQTDKPAILHVTGGSRNTRDNIRGYEGLDQLDLAALARDTGTLVAEIKDVPNQYLFIEGESPRKEDEIIARSWAAFLKDPTCTDCPVQLPMTRAIVKAMDVVQALMSDKAPESFIVTGGSKRGWVTWLTAAVDSRVVAIAPMVIDVLNVQQSLDHLKRVYGHWIPPLQPYMAEGQNVIDQLHTPAMHRLMELVDPFSYRRYLTLPKYVITASGDDFFPPDGTRHYWSDLDGTKLLRTYPNSRHYIYREDAQRVTDTISSFVGYILQGKEFPSLDTEKLSASGGELMASEKPVRVTLWQAVNPNARDFRKTTLQPLGESYKSSDLKAWCTEVKYNKAFVRCSIDVDIKPPASGYKAWFVELAFENGSLPDLVLTTPVEILGAGS